MNLALQENAYDVVSTVLQVYWRSESEKTACWKWHLWHATDITVFAKYKNIVL